MSFRRQDIQHNVTQHNDIMPYMLSVEIESIMLSVIMVNVISQSVVAPWGRSNKTFYLLFL